MSIKSRRDFMKTAISTMGGLGVLGSFGKFGEMNALASTSAPYQALVCIFLAGGNDSHNMVVPINTAQQNYGVYAQGRQGLALPQAALLTHPERLGHVRLASQHAGSAGALQERQCGDPGQRRDAGAAHFAGTVSRATTWRNCRPNSSRTRIRSTNGRQPSPTAPLRQAGAGAWRTVCWRNTTTRRHFHR